MNSSDDSPAGMACPTCGEPLSALEVQSGGKCARCANQNFHMGLLPGEHLHDCAASGPLGEIGSSRSGSHVQAYPGSEQEPRNEDAAGGQFLPVGPAPGSMPGYYQPPAGYSDQTLPLQPGWNAGGVDYHGTSRPSEHNGSGRSYDPSAPNNAPYENHGYWDSRVSTTLDHTGQSPDAAYDPDRPAWGLPTGFGVWVFSVLSIMLFPSFAVVLWIGLERAQGVQLSLTPEQLQHDPTIVFIALLATAGAHLFTILLLWASITRFGQRPFWASLGWKWSAVPPWAKYGVIGGALVFSFIAIDFWWAIPGKFKVGALLGFGVFAMALYLAVFLFRPSMATWSKVGFVVGAVALALVIDIILSSILPQSKGSDFEEMLSTSGSVRILISVLAVFTAPLVEEGVYRGVLYAALRRVLGLTPSVVIVTLLFAGVHVPQYWGAWTSIASITVLSILLTLVRAKTKSLYPCIAIHFLFNLVNSAFILVHKY